MNEEKKQNGAKKYVWTAFALIMVVGFLLYWNDPLEKEGAKEIINVVCNSFTVPGVFFSGIAALTYLAKLGAYDSFGYTFSNFSLHNLWFSKQPKKYKSFYDYKVAKDEKGRHWWKEGLFVGLASLAVSGILLIVYLIL
ncbi:MAG: DUF3899 domain-containing protein [Clostridia bacterium]|nr:DUF3899 domain-containing protein [Clostridia bacterium]